MPTSLVYVVILNWNLQQETAECVSSVLESDYPHCQVLVVDNGSTDGSPEGLRRSFPEIEVIVNPANLGFAKGSNVGIRHALQGHAEYVFLLNNDTVVDGSMLGKLVDTAENNVGVGIVAPKILYYGDRDRIWRLGGRVHRWLPVPQTLGKNELDDGRYAEPFDVDYVTFCGALIKRTVLDTVGLLDERFFFSYEDSDFCHRTRQAGYRIICQPQARMWHKVSVSAQKDSVNTRYSKSKGRAMFYRLHPHGPHASLTALWVLASTLVTAADSVLRGNASLAKAALQGLVDGFRSDMESM